MKKILMYGIAGLVVFGVAGVLCKEFALKTIDAEKILEQSVFKNRTFSGEVTTFNVLDNKVSAYLMEEHSLPLVAMSFSFAKSGKAYVNKEGVALLAESVLLDGAGEWSRQQLREFMRERGIKLGVSVGNDRLEFSLSYVKEFEKDALAVLKAVLYEPRLEKEDLDLACLQLSAWRKRKQENPQQVLSDFVREEFFKSHPYGLDDVPDDDVLAQVNAQDIRDYLKKFAGKDNLTIGISGDIDKATAVAFVADAFAKLEDKSAGSELPEFNFEAKYATKEFNTSAQSFVLLSGKGIKRLDKDFYPLYIADYIFGGSGLMSRISQAVREKEGLTYGIYSYFSNSDAVDLWQIYFSATPDNVQKILDIVDEEYRDFYDNGVSEEELERAKSGLMSSFNLRFASLFNIAEMLKEMQVQKLGVDFLQKRQKMVQEVTLKQVNDAIRNKMPSALNVEGEVNRFEIIGKKK